MSAFNAECGARVVELENLIGRIKRGRPHLRIGHEQIPFPLRPWVLRDVANGHELFVRFETREAAMRFLRRAVQTGDVTATPTEELVPTLRGRTVHERHAARERAREAG